MTDTTTTETIPGPVDLDAIRARTTVATPGPWAIVERNGDPIRRKLRGADDQFILGLATLLYPDPADEEFLTHAREDVPALLDEVDRLRQALAEVAKHQEDMADSLDDSITHDQIHEQLLIGMRLAADARG